jgi:hypothetical protein
VLRVLRELEEDLLAQVLGTGCSAQTADECVHFVSVLAVGVGEGGHVARGDGNDEVLVSQVARAPRVAGGGG